MRYKIKDCFNTEDFRKLAKKKLPFPVFHYIDGAADDEVTYARNTSAFDDVDLVPNVLRGVEEVDLSTTIWSLSCRYSWHAWRTNDYASRIWDNEFKRNFGASYANGSRISY